MLFNSPEFILLFLPIVLLMFFWIGRYSIKLSAYWLFIASLSFYSWWNPLDVPLLLTSIVFNYSVGRYLAAKSYLHARKAALTIGICINLALLFRYKYFMFVMQVIGVEQASTAININAALPLGISFFTFTQIAFLVDAYRREVNEYQFGQYGLFVTFFPHLIAGPILHHKEMMPQFQDAKIYRPDYENLSVGMTLFVIGLFKKVILADGIAPYASLIFLNSHSSAGFGFVEAWLGIMAYSFQLYFDFSGYSDMALGLGRMFGIRLPMNFYSPYKAQSMLELWRRWHMTLSRFLRDYVFVPLGGKKKSSIRRYASLFLTMVVGGIWHGAGWTFVVWGTLLGSMLVLNHAWLIFRRRSNWAQPGYIARFFACAGTYAGFTLGLAFFRSDTLATASHISSALLWFGAKTILGAVDLATLTWVAICGFIVWGLPNSQQLLQKYQPAIETYPGIMKARRIFWFEWQPNIPWAMAIGTTAIASIGMLSRIREFLYFAF
jgi:alginate O-acetyltransferase complex protein AlgI